MKPLAQSLSTASCDCKNYKAEENTQWSLYLSRWTIFLLLNKCFSFVLGVENSGTETLQTSINFIQSTKYVCQIGQLLKLDDILQVKGVMNKDYINPFSFPNFIFELKSLVKTFIRDLYVVLSAML